MNLLFSADGKEEVEKTLKNKKRRDEQEEGTEAKREKTQLKLTWDAMQGPTFSLIHSLRGKKSVTQD